MNEIDSNFVRACALGLLIAAPVHVAWAFDTTVACDANRVTNLVNLVGQSNTTPGVDTIRLTSGCLFTFSASAFTAADASSSALNVTDSLNLFGNGATIERDPAAATPAFRLISVTAGDTLTVTQLTLRNGLSRGAPGQSGVTPGGAYTIGGTFGGRGGAILSEGALTGSELRFEGNRAEGGAGGSGFNGSAGGGGGAGLGGALYVAGTGGTLSRCVFANNVAAGGPGGGQTGGFPGSQAGAGGGSSGGRGGYYDGTQRAGEPGGFGGGGGGQSFGSPGGGVGGFGGGGGGTWFGILTGTTYGGGGGEGGFGGGGGGGLGGAVFANASLTVTNCTFSANQAQGANAGSGGGGGSGAGGSAFARAGTLTLRFVTMVAGGALGGNAPGGGNGATGGNGTGGNIQVDGGAIVLETSIIADGATTAGTGADGGANGTTSNPDIAGAVTSNGFNIVRARGTSTGYIGSDLANGTNPQVGALANNGGNTLTHALLAGSPAINAIPAGALCATPTDQRGSQRPIAGSCDIGAFELVPDPLFANGFE